MNNADYVQRAPAPAQDGDPAIPIEITLLTRDRAKFWDQQVQPVIREESARAYRADARWNWRRLLFLTAGTVLVGHRCYGLAVLVRNLQNQRVPAVPAGLLLVVEHVEPMEQDGFAQVLRAHHPHLYLWFLSAATIAALLPLGVPRIPSLGTVLIDAGIVTSANGTEEGRIWLHAAACRPDPVAAQRLFGFYRNKCGFLAVGTGAHEIVFPVPLTAIRRRNGGRNSGRTSRPHRRCTISICPRDTRRP